ncbi:MAG TPA: hypothetical protein VNA25_05990 [Phycisphaerae bacterium]|nr:hypothetical protein [Phycisphaerae bacterium]
MGYMLRKIRERAIEGGYLAAPVKKAKPMVTRAPGKHDRTYAELQIAAAKQREEKAAKKQERARQREATQVQKPGTWDKIRTRLGGLFRRKV